MSEKHFSKQLISLIMLFLLITMLVFPKETSSSVRYALSLCAESVIPSLFPFLVLTRMISDMRLCSPLERIFKKIMNPVFSLSDAAVTPLLLGFISGYPIGAAMCATEYQNGRLNKREAERLLAFSNNAGPAFILSTVGTVLFSSFKIGFALLVIHIFSAFLVGFLFRIISPLPHPQKNVFEEAAPKAFSFAFTDAVYGAITASLSITAYIVFFSVFTSLTDILLSARLFAFTSRYPLFKGALNGIFELTSGAFLLCEKTKPETAFILISTLLGWGGFCIHFQAMSFVKKTDLKTKEYFIGKLLQAAISAITAFFTANSSFFDAVYTFSESVKTGNLSITYALLTLIVVFVCFFSKKRWKSVFK